VISVRKVFVLFHSFFENQLKNMELEGVFSTEAKAKKYAADECGEMLDWDNNWDGDGTPGAEVVRHRSKRDGGETYKILYFIEQYFLDDECLNKKSV
jgi:hypothetical protein